MLVDRRTVLVGTLSFLASSTFARSAPGQGPTAAPTETARLLDMIVVNSCGDLGDPNHLPQPGESVSKPQLTPRILREALASGLTAVNITLSGEPRPEGVDVFESVVGEIADWDEALREHPESLLKVFFAEDIRRAKSEHKVGVIYGFQDSMIGSRPQRIDVFYNLGVKISQLTYNARNDLGGGCLAPEVGLTPLGRQVVDRMNAVHMILDLAHSGTQLCLDAVRYSKEPICISHTGCRAIVDVPRNKSDEELRLVAERGGYIGIFFIPCFLTKSGIASASDVILHLEHAINVCGEDHVGIGTDMSVTGPDDLEAFRAYNAKVMHDRQAQGISTPGESADLLPFLTDIRDFNQFRQFASLLEKRGWSTTRIEKIVGANFVRYARDVWGR